MKDDGSHDDSVVIEFDDHKVNKVTKKKGD